MTITVDFSRLHPAAYETWTAIGRLVASTNIQTWAVVGGQMVAVHATSWGVEVPRATDDGDIVVDVRTFTRSALRDVADALVADGFGSEQSPEGIVRFTKGDAKIDLLAPDGLGAEPVETGKGRVVQAPGATQAVKRAGPVIVELASERFEVCTPNLLGAIVAKAAAATEVVSASRFAKQKHERDLATLLMCAAQDPKLERWAEAMTKKDRKRLDSARRAFLDDAHPCWSDGADRSDIETVLDVLLE